MTDRIPGGLAQNKTLEDLANHHSLSTHVLKFELEKGIKVEKEHTTDEFIAKEIAMDHLWEDPEYYSKLEKTNLEEIKINKPDIVFKITIPQEWNEKLIKVEDQLKCYDDIVVNNVKFFQYLSDSIGENIISYVKSLIEGELNRKDQMVTLFTFDIFSESIYYYLTRLQFDPKFLSDEWININNIIVKNFDKGIINLTQIENFCKNDKIDEVKIEKPITTKFRPGEKVFITGSEDIAVISNDRKIYYYEGKYLIYNEITHERFYIPEKYLKKYQLESFISKNFSIIPELKKLIEYTNQDILNPNVFNGLKIKPKVREILLKIANYFWENTEIKTPYEDILLLGSSANYNWTENSDIDVHILYNFSLSNQKTEDFKKYIDIFVQNFNTTYDFKIKNNPIQLYVQDVIEKNHSIGVYSLVNSKWIQKPIKEKIDIPDKQIQRYAGIFKKKIDNLINSTNESVLNKIKQLKDEIKDFRQKGLDSSEGEYSIENLVFKELRNSGYLEKLYNWKTEYLNQKLSLPEAKNIGKLYHFTGLLQLTKIIEDDMLKPILSNTMQDLPYVSFTRNQNFHNENRYSVSTQCRIVIDGNKLSSKYKIKSYSDPEYSFKGHKPESETDPFEYEERIQTKQIEDLDKFVISYDIFLEESLKGLSNAWVSLNSEDFQFILNNKKIRIFKSKKDLILISNKEAFNKIKNEIELNNEKVNEIKINNPITFKSPLKVKDQEHWDKVISVLKSKGYRWRNGTELKSEEWDPFYNIIILSDLPKTIHRQSFIHPDENKEIFFENLSLKDTKKNIIELSKFLKEKLELPYLPKTKFINNDKENADNSLGKTAYYDPNNKMIVLYTMERHPKDITRSFSHEMVHFKQDLDGRLNNIQTQNVNEDEYLAELEREAYEKGNMLFRSWENSKRLNEIKINDPFKYKIFKVESLKDTDYFRADQLMYLLDLGKYYTFVPQGGDYDDPANKLYLINKNTVKKTEDQDDGELIRINNDLKSFDLKNHLSKLKNNGIEYIK